MLAREASAATTHAALSLSLSLAAEAAQHAVEYQQRDRKTFRLFPSLASEGRLQFIVISMGFVAEIVA